MLLMTPDSPKNEGAGREDRRIPDPAELYRAEIDAAERKVAGEIDPGFTAVVIAATVLLLLLSLALPHAGNVSGWDVLTAASSLEQESIALMSRLFVWFLVIFGVVVSILALVTRRWVLALVAAAGCTVSSVFGMLAIWSRQTLAANEPGSGVGSGLVIGLAALAVLVVLWLRVVWTRSLLDSSRSESSPDR
jgi:hypothetical protein